MTVGLWTREKSASPEYEPGVAYLRVGESLLVDIVSLRSRTLVFYPVLLVVGLHEEAVGPRVISDEATHQLAVQVGNDGSIGQMASVVTVIGGPFGVCFVIGLLPLVARWDQHVGLGGGQPSASGGATPSVGSDERVVDLLSVAGALE